MSMGHVQQSRVYDGPTTDDGGGRCWSCPARTSRSSDSSSLVLRAHRVEEIACSSTMFGRLLAARIVEIHGMLQRAQCYTGANGYMHICARQDFGKSLALVPIEFYSVTTPCATGCQQRLDHFSLRTRYEGSWLLDRLGHHGQKAPRQGWRRVDKCYPSLASSSLFIVLAAAQTYCALLSTLGRPQKFRVKTESFYRKKRWYRVG